MNSRKCTGHPSNFTTFERDEKGRHGCEPRLDDGLVNLVHYVNTAMSSSSSAVPVPSAAGGTAGLTPATQPRVSRWVGAFLRAVLMPLIVFGIPAWPVLGVLCAGGFYLVVFVPSHPY